MQLREEAASGGESRENGMQKLKEGGASKGWVDQLSTKLPPMSKETLTERHAPPGFDPGLTGWVPAHPPSHIRSRNKSGV